MATTVAKYTFSSWLRKGIGSKIEETDNLGGGTSAATERARIPIDVEINGQNIHKDFDLVGPGDIVGINPAMVVRTEPRDWITNHEPNLLVFAEFYDEDFAWRYTPAKANGNRLRPWIVLLVLKEDEFTKDNGALPLPSITITDVTALPPVGDIWAWAHAHVNEGHASTTEFEKFLESLHDLDNPNADKIVCRLMSPRKLEPKTAYHAFVVPAFETGRLAGLKQETKDVPAQKPAWDASSINPKLPVYYQWYFRTGENEDFESLVKLLEPRIVDPRVGIRDMDGTRPGFGAVNGTDIGAIAPPTAPQDIVGLEGALKAATTTSRPLAIDTSKPFLAELQTIVNFPAQLKKQTNAATDPVVSPPIYGENHALLHELDVTKTGWLHALNKDPRNRVPAGFGTDVIQRNQDSYTARAWAQVQKILDANRRIKLAAFAMTVAEMVKKNFTGKLSPQQSLLFFSPLLKKVKGSPTTLHTQLQSSLVPPAAVGAAFRRILRPRGATARRLRAADAGFKHTRLIDAFNSKDVKKRVSAAPPRLPPKDLQTIEGIAARLPSGRFGAMARWLIRNRVWLLLILLAVLLLVGLGTGVWASLGAVALAGLGAFVFASRQADQLATEEALVSPRATASRIASLPQRPDFRLVETDPAVPPVTEPGTTVTRTIETVPSGPDLTRFEVVSLHTPAGGGDSVEAKNFRTAAVAMGRRLSIEVPKRSPTTFDVANAGKKIAEATDPRVAYPKQLAALVNFSFNPGWLHQAENLVPAMAYPDFEDPMYEKLRDISPELMLPNLNLIPPNTISLLVTNPIFIESYMVGLNDQMGRELLWREYPTDQRGSYFRQFWDVKGIITNEGGLSDEKLVDAYKDITPIDTWESPTKLGEHNRTQGEANLVLVVRGELFKKYPNTIVYAQKAHIFKRSNGTADPSHEPVIIEVASAADMEKEIKFPQFKADIDPDYKFFGFDMTIEQAYGDESPSQEADDWGYYFVIQQIPGEPRFGMDIQFDPDDDPTTPITWDDLAWDRYPEGKRFIESSVKPVSSFVPGGPDTLGQWGTDSAAMAYILYQKPVMIAVHARQMLDKLNG